MSNRTEKFGEGERRNGNRGMGNDLHVVGEIRGQGEQKNGVGVRVRRGRKRWWEAARKAV